MPKLKRKKKYKLKFIQNFVLLNAPKSMQHYQCGFMYLLLSKNICEN